jgi:PadR family transcriptional regulator PadR
MEHGTPIGAEEGASRFELAPPRRFILPAILLLLSEHPGYGYGLVPRLEEFHFGHVDRPAVYRALAQLETDGLVAAGSRNPGAGQARRMYSVTPLGERVLRVWMGVIKEEYDYLGQALRRYQATGTIDAVLAEVEGGWSSALGAGWSPVSTSAGRRRSLPPEATNATVEASVECGETQEHELGSFALDPDRSAVLIDVRSTVGPLSFGTLGVTQWHVAHRRCSFGPPHHRCRRAQLRQQPL